MNFPHPNPLPEAGEGAFDSSRLGMVSAWGSGASRRELAGLPKGFGAAPKGLLRAPKGFSARTIGIGIASLGIHFSHLTIRAFSAGSVGRRNRNDSLPLGEISGERSRRFTWA